MYLKNFLTCAIGGSSSSSSAMRGKVHLLSTIEVAKRHLSVHWVDRMM